MYCLLATSPHVRWSVLEQLVAKATVPAVTAADLVVLTTVLRWNDIVAHQTETTVLTVSSY